MHESDSEGSGSEYCIPVARIMTITDGKFFKLIPEKCSRFATVGKCVKCEPETVEVRGIINTPTSFIRHLRRRHGPEAVEDYDEYLRAKKLNMTRSGQRQLKSNKNQPIVQTKSAAVQKKFERGFLKFVIHSTIPLNTCANPHFLKLFRQTNEECRDIYDKIFVQLKTDLTEASHVFCTAGIWDGEFKSVLATTAHWINDDMKSKSAVLGFQELSPLSFAEFATNLINQIKGEFRLLDAKTCIVVGEYTCNYARALNAYGVQYSSLGGQRKSKNDDEDDLTLDNDQLLPVVRNHFKCPVQTLITYASVFIARRISDSHHLSKMHERVMKKCNLLWSHPRCDAVLQELAGFTLPKPLSTNWTSVYNSLREILKIQRRNNQIFQALGIEDGFWDTEYVYIEEHVTCTKPFADAIDTLQSIDHSLFGSLLPTLLALRRHLNKRLKREWVYCRPIVEENVRNVDEMFQAYYNVSTPEAMDAVIAAFSHPEFKNTWLYCIERKDRPRLLTAFKESVRAELPTPSSPDLRSIKPSQRDDLSDCEAEDETMEALITPIAAADAEVLKFFNHPSKSINCLNNFPTLKKVFLKYNTPLSSFAAVDRMLDYYTLSEVLSTDRPIDESVETRVLLKANLHVV